VCEGIIDSDGNHWKLRGARRECQSTSTIHYEARELVQMKRFPDKKEKILSPEFRLATNMGFVP